MLSTLYNAKVLRLAATISRTEPLPRPDLTAARHSPVCGSTITVSLNTDGDIVRGYSQKIQACALGQAAASVLGRVIVGKRRAEIAAAAAALRAMLGDGATPPGGDWADLGALQPAAEVTSRHGAILLAFDAVEDCFRQSADQPGDRPKRACTAAPE